MQASLPCKIVANVIIGSRPEPFFASCLASVSRAVDFLILNDNSGSPDNPNLIPFRESKLHKQGKTALIQSNLKSLSGLDEARNLCLLETGRRFSDEPVWVLYLDADEVHTNGLEMITRKFLPRLSPEVSAVDGYFLPIHSVFRLLCVP